MNTSIYLHESISIEISKISEQSNISKSKLVRMLIKKIKNFNSINDINGALIEYQDKYSGDSEIVHYVSDPQMSDFTNRLRFRCRISLSKLVCASFLFFWDQILDEIFGNEEIKEDFIISYEKKIEKFNFLVEYFIKRLNLEVKRE